MTDTFLNNHPEESFNEYWIILNMQVTSEAWLKQLDTEIYFSLGKNENKNKLKTTEFMLFLLIIPLCWLQNKLLTRK